MAKIYLVAAVSVKEVSYYDDGYEVSESYYVDIEHAEKAFDAVKDSGAHVKLFELAPDEDGMFAIVKLLKEVK